MEFSGQYLKYEEYRGLGGTLDQLPFNLLEFEARRRIDERTWQRLQNAEVIPQAVKLCMYHLINKIYEYIDETDKQNRNVASENIDGYSVSYISGSQITEVMNAKNSELNDIIRTYLLGVVVNGEHIMYLGVE